jgi:Alpha/beta hydrolase domain
MLLSFSHAFSHARLGRRPTRWTLTRNLGGRSLVALALLATLSGAAGAGSAALAQNAPGSRDAPGIDWLEIKSIIDAYGGASFGAAGSYEYIAAVAHGRLDPKDPANAGIVDLDRAPRTNGLVEYQTDVGILRPKDPALARRVLFYDVVNRGNKIALTTYFNEGAANPTNPEDAGNAFLMRQGYTVVWSGWQGDIAMSGDGTRIGADFPVATNPDGTPVTGPSREEIVFDDTTSTSMSLTWPTATRDAANGSLRVKEHQTDPWTDLPSSDWTWQDDKTIQIDRPSDLDAGAIYEFTYTARDPKVMGIGFAAVRDLVTFLKEATADNRGTPNPLNDLRQAPCETPDPSGACATNPPSTVDVSLIEGISQSGRFTRDFIWQGFNASTSGGRVFDGAMPLIAGSRKTWTNFRFAQPGRWSKQHEDHLQAGDQFPFTYATTTDPVSGQTDGILNVCTASNTCPKVMHLDGGGEFWLARASLIVADGAGNEVPLPDNVRAYLMTGTPHGYSLTGKPTTVPACANPTNIVYVGFITRALAPALVDWIARGVEPPPSRYPSLSAGTLANPTSRSDVGFPDLESIGVAYTGIYNFLSVTNYAVVPPVVDASKSYRVFVPTANSDGIDLPGVRSPDLTVPLGTSMPWNPRAAGFAEGDQCVSNGSFIPFAPTEAERAQSGDPRPSLQERHASRADYVARVRAAALALRDEGFMLQDDVDFSIARAETTPLLP